MTPSPYGEDMSTTTTAQELAEAVAADGFAAHRAALAALFTNARRLGVTPILVDIAEDPSEARAVRERALGRVVVQYCRLVEAGDGDRTVSAA